MKKKSTMILIIAFFIYICYLFCSREFYIIKGVPITMYGNYVVIGRWYCGLLRPQFNYVKFSPFDSYPIITFHTAKNISICASTNNTEINLKDYECIYFEDPITLPSKEYEKYQKAPPFLFSINLWWDFGTYFYQFVYQDDYNLYKYIEHGGFWRWDAGIINQ